jgi:hypothetical protein
MKDLSIPFSLFDFFAVLLPGAVGLGGLYLFINPSLTQAGHDAAFAQLAFQQLDSDLVIFTCLVLASYLVGQVLNALAELLIDMPANRLFGAHIIQDLNHHAVQKATRKHFGADIVKQSYRRTFNMMEALVGANLAEAAASAKRFIALAVMFQSLALALIVITAALIRGYLINAIFPDSFAGLAVTIVSVLVLIALLLWSYRRYKRMWSQTVAMSFVAWVNPGQSAKTNRAR